MHQATGGDADAHVPVESDARVDRSARCLAFYDALGGVSHGRELPDVSLEVPARACVTTFRRQTSPTGYQRRKASIRGPRHFLRLGPLPSDFK